MMANVFRRIGSSISSLVDKVFNRSKPAPAINRSRVECIYGPPEMLEARRAGRKPEPDPDPEPVDLYGPPLAGEEGPEEECDDAVEEITSLDAKQVPQRYPIRNPNEPTCIYGPPPAR